MAGTSSSVLYIPDDMIEEAEGVTAEGTIRQSATLSTIATSRPPQPQSLRSLANFTTRTPPSSSQYDEHAVQERADNDNNEDEDEVPLEPELKHGAATFVTLESDLGALFGPPAVPSASSTSYLHQQHHHQEQSTGPSYSKQLQSTASSSSLSLSFSRTEFEQELCESKEREAVLQREVEVLRGSVEQLELDSIDLSEELGRVKQEQQRGREDGELQRHDLQLTVQDLRTSLKEKEDDVSSAAMRCYVM
jgi:hypothetical protein